MLLRIIYGTATISDRNCERSNLGRKCRNNCKFNEGILYYWKKTDSSHMLYDSSFNGRLSHELQGADCEHLSTAAIKEKKIMVAALPVQQQTAVHLPVG